MRTVSYNLLREDLDTGDILLWSSDSFFSRLIQTFCKSTWSHVGMVVKFPGDLLMLWESTLDDQLSGVRLTPLSQSLCDTVAVRKMHIERTPHLFEAIMKVRKELNGRPFESDLMQMLCAGYDGPFGHNNTDLTSLFCSELIAETLIRVGILDSEKPSNEYTPKDFSSEASAPLRLLNNVSLDKEILVDYNSINKQSAKSLNKSNLINRIIPALGS
jgi:hypothetical protein